MEWQKDHYKISTNPSLLDLSVIHHFLSREAYWCEGVTGDTHSLFQQFGFMPVRSPENFMEKLTPDIYQQQD